MTTFAASNYYMYALIFFFSHWYLSLFFQTLFHHRYSAHRQFTMSKGMEKVFFILSYLFQNSSYLSPYAYGIMHRMHHAFADKPEDPHSPIYSKGFLDMMMKTKVVYSGILKGETKVEERFLGNVPTWMKFDLFTDQIWVRSLWIPVYIGIYYLLGAPWWLATLLIPIHLFMGPVHGAVINWFAHKVGYVNFKVSDTSKNILPVDILMLGEGYHNNHHRHPNRANFGWKWHELDPVYPFIKLFSWVGIIKMRKIEPVTEKEVG